MAKPTQHYKITPLELTYASGVANNPKYKQKTTPEEFAGNMFKYTSEYNDDLASNLIRAKENIVQGVGLPGALLGVYALGNKPKKGSRIPGVLGAVGGAYLGKTLYDFAANNESTKKYVSDFTDFVNKHTGGVGGQYVPMAAQALGGLLGYGLLKSSNYNMNKYAADKSGLSTVIRIARDGSIGTGALLGGAGIYNAADSARNSLEQVTPALNTTISDIDRHVNTLGDAGMSLVDNANATVTKVDGVADDAKNTLTTVDKSITSATNSLTDKIPGILAITGIGVGVPLAVYLAKRNNKSKKNKRYAK